LYVYRRIERITPASAGAKVAVTKGNVLKRVMKNKGKKGFAVCDFKPPFRKKRREVEWRRSMLVAQEALRITKVAS
jgi:hypothetical protein